MTGLDTNVLVRYLVRDDPGQTAKATRFIEAECTSESPGHISRIVLCELVWVLIGGYGYDKKDVLNVLEHLLAVTQLHVETPQAVKPAVAAYASGSADFADYLIVQTNRADGCARTVSFDKRAAKAGAFSLLS